MKTIAVLGTFDTKGQEHAHLAQCIREHGYETLLIDVGTHPANGVEPHIVVREQFGLTETEDRGKAITEMAAVVPELIRDLAHVERIQGITSLGGSGGTAIGTAAMRSLPLGFPKVMVSTLAGKDVTAYVDISDIVMVPSIVDVGGLNLISKGVFARTAAMVVALAETNRVRQSKAAGKVTERDQTDKPIVVASMFGNTTPCIEHARKLLEVAGYEVLVFHATGTGGRTMEAIIATGVVAGVLDLTTTEWADELVGGVMRGGPERLETAAKLGVPAVIAPGCLDMVNFGERTSIPQKFQGRLFYQHNPQVTLMRTTAEECRTLGSILGEKLSLSTGPIEVFFPARAISIISAPGQPFHDPQADQSLLDGLRARLRADIPLTVLDCEINDPIFAERCVRSLLKLLSSRS